MTLFFLSLWLQSNFLFSAVEVFTKMSFLDHYGDVYHRIRLQNKDIQIVNGDRGKATSVLLIGNELIPS